MGARCRLISVNVLASRVPAAMFHLGMLAAGGAHGQQSFWKDAITGLF